MKNIVFASLLIAGFVVGCSSPKEEPSKTSGSQSTNSNSTQNKDSIMYQKQPKAQEQPTTNNPPATNAASLKPDVTSVAQNGGLGDTFEQLVKVFGEPTRVNTPLKDGYGWFGFKNDLLLIRLEEGRARHIGIQLDTQRMSMSEAEATEFIKTFLPPDATVVKQYDKDEMEKVIVHHSKTLKGFFSEKKFENADGEVHPGEFDVIFVHMDGKVDAIKIFTGDHP